jgi:phenylpropionate dioxygenase-like ring-hydroxylating dioxygenase large terminal subunit
MSSVISESQEVLAEPVIIPVDAYISPDYARAERDRLWRKVWQRAGRVEEIPAVGDYLTYEILDDSVLIVRSSPDTITALHNVCAHRGRRLVDTPPGARNAHGKKKQFVCSYHGWCYNLEGANTHVPYESDWQGTLANGCSSLKKVKVDTWGGWLWINLDPNCQSLRSYLEPAASLLDPFKLENMRVRWRKWVIFDCNWKVAMEAFNETYHVQATHPEFNKFGDFRGWSKVQGMHSNIGYDAPSNVDENQKAKLRLGIGDDLRLATAELQVYTWEKAQTNTTRTLVDAALRLADELPKGTPPDQVLKHWLNSARTHDESRGVIWPTVDPSHVGKSGTSWSIFPNTQIGHSVNNMLAYAARPYRYDPDKCIFEAAIYELFPPGEEPETQWQYAAANAAEWNFVLAQDFGNMAAVQQGLKSMGFSGARPNPYMERATANLHRMLAKYMGAGAPRPVDR